MAETGSGAAAGVDRATIRTALRRQYQRTVHDPFKTGVVVDPAVQRWNYARHNAYDHFKIRPKSSAIGLILGIIAPAIVIFTVAYERKSRFEKIEDGRMQKPKGYLYW